MYSVVLMMAMTGGSDAPAGIFDHGCCGGGYSCSGCSGYSCSGYGCSGSGCCGGSCHGGGHKLFGGHGCCGGGHGLFGGHGCCGGGHGLFSGHGCCGGGHGLFGGHGCCGGGHGLFGGHGHGCCGGSGCCGGYACSGGYGCSGSWGCAGSGCAGGWNCGGCAGGVMYGVPGTEMKKEKEEEISAPATLVVKLPADARLLIDGNVTTSTSDVRTFRTPVLPAGEFRYTLQAEIVRDGKTLTLTKNVNVRAGAETTLTFDAAEMAAVASR
jgi:uncharacterized protein (TIGR03000 family)